MLSQIKSIRYIQLVAFALTLISFLFVVGVGFTSLIEFHEGVKWLIWVCVACVIQVICYFLIIITSDRY